MSMLRNLFANRSCRAYGNVVASMVVIWGAMSFMPSQTCAQSLEWQVGSMGRSASFRGLSVVDGETVWACGGKGSVVHTIDGGKNWKDCSPKGFEQLEFRSIHAFDAKTVCVASAGTPAVLLRTIDGGQNWTEVYRNDSPKAFFDAMVFWTPTDGLAVSDPVDGHWLLVRTDDAGLHWKVLEGPQAPKALEGEAAFAASNGSLAVIDGQRWWLGTGGATGAKEASLLHWSGNKNKWHRTASPLATSESAGIFAIEFARHPFGVLVGGDYKKEKDPSSSSAWTEDGGETWHEPLEPLSGYRSSVVDWQRSDGTRVFVAVGPSGTDISQDGKRWTSVSSVGFHTARSTPNGKLWSVGSDGRFGWAE